MGEVRSAWWRRPSCQSIEWMALVRFCVSESESRVRRLRDSRKGCMRGRKCQDWEEWRKEDSIWLTWAGVGDCRREDQGAVVAWGSSVRGNWDLVASCWLLVVSEESGLG